jgi:hypothetical protein
MCPNNPLGTADVFMVSHHGQPRSNLPLLVHAIEARVAIMNNGIRKGGQPKVMAVLHSAPGLETLWQLHVSQRSGREYNAPELFVANLTAGSDHDGTAYWIKVSARPDGSFTSRMAEMGSPKTYVRAASCSASGNLRVTRGSRVRRSRVVNDRLAVAESLSSTRSAGAAAFFSASATASARALDGSG